MRAVLIIVALFALVEVSFIATQLRRMAQAMDVANCVTLADRGIVCPAAGGDKPKPKDRGTT